MQEYVELAGYRAEHGNWVDKLIAWWTDSSYSHTELVVDGSWYSASIRENKIRISDNINRHSGHWDFVSIPVTKLQKESIISWYKVREGCKYDFLGILLSQIVKLNVHDKVKWFCSESNAEALKQSGAIQLRKPSNWYSPERLMSCVL